MDALGRGSPSQRWQEILRRIAIALKGREVGVCEADSHGHMHLLAANSSWNLDPTAVDEVESTLRELGVLPPSSRSPRRWLAGRLKPKHWCVAPVRSAMPEPPPAGVERRSAERLTLELGGVCIGLIEAPDRDLEDFVEHTPVGLRWMAPDGTILRANPAELEMLGYSSDEYVGRNIVAFHVDVEVGADILLRLQAGEPLRNVETRLRRRDGSICYGLLSASARFDAGALVHARCLTRDITERRLQEVALAQFKAMVESADDAVIGKTIDGVITTWNPAATRLYGYAAEEAIGQPISLIAPDRVDELRDILERLRRGEPVERMETTRTRKDGTPVEVTVTISPIRDRHGHVIGATSIAHDITERKRVEQQLHHAALHDALTDLPNRAYLVERVSQAQARVRRDPNYQFAVLFIDSDNFKAVNDSFGHATGDRLLTEIATRLRTCVRPHDVVARLGGDEFAVLLEEIVGRADAERAARRVRDTLAAPVSLQGRDIVATASIGVALNQPGAKASQDLLHDADLAMYHAKQEGGARFKVFDVTMRESAQARASIEADLRSALARQEFRLVFHPIVELLTGRVRGFEALLRWHHPARGVIPPLEFVPLAEETGLILPIGSWVIAEACRCARRWQEAFPAAGPLQISVNVSAKQLERESIVDDVRTTLQEVGLPPSQLVLEITESMLMKDVEASTALLRRLRALGVELHMDDFGTGYSSLGQLPLLPIQGLKIHHMFVHRMGARRTDLEIVRSVVDLARTLRLGVIAEGVDTVAQRERLIGLGCEFGQGSLFAEPLEPAAASAFLAAPRELVV